MFIAYQILKLSRSPRSLRPRNKIGSSGGRHLRSCLLHSTQHKIESFPKLETELKMITKDFPCRL